MKQMKQTKENEAIDVLKQWVWESRRIVFFGGAGVSTESGIPDFRSADGLYRQQFQYPPEYMLSHDFFIEHPDAFYEFYREKLLYPNAKPNAAHCKLALLESLGRLIAVVTQNVDGLHQAAGSKNVYELHGSAHRYSCTSCGALYGLAFIRNGTGAPKCTQCGGIVRPDVVLYQEQLDNAVVRGAQKAIAAADMLIVGGTSLSVYPAAGLIEYYTGSRLVMINRTETPYDGEADLIIRSGIGEALGKV